jgi:hypothetical protein
MALAAFAPWAMLRLIPLAEIASAAAGSLTSGSSGAIQRLRQSDAWAAEGDHWAAKTAGMRDAAREAAVSTGGRATSENLAANATRPAPASPAPDERGTEVEEQPSQRATKSGTAAGGSTSPSPSTSAPSGSHAEPPIASNPKAAADPAIASNPEAAADQAIVAPPDWSGTGPGGAGTGEPPSGEPLDIEDTPGAEDSAADHDDHPLDVSDPLPQAQRPSEGGG